MVYLYDDAIVEDLRTRINDERVTITPYENLINSLAKSEEDEIKLPIISIERTGWSISDARPHAMKFTGDISRIEKNPTKVVNVYAMPIRINYILDVWTKRRLDNDNIMRELIFYYSVNPTLQIKVPYGLEEIRNFNVFFGSDIEDNSNIPEHKNIGEYVRQTIPFYVDDAYLWRSDYRGPTYVDADGLYLDINKGSVIEKVEIPEVPNVNDFGSEIDINNENTTEGE